LKNANVGDSALPTASELDAVGTAMLSSNIHGGSMDGVFGSIEWGVGSTDAQIFVGYRKAGTGNYALGPDPNRADSAGNVQRGLGVSLANIKGRIVKIDYAQGTVTLEVL